MWCCRCATTSPQFIDSPSLRKPLTAHACRPIRHAFAFHRELTVFLVTQFCRTSGVAACRCRASRCGPDSSPLRSPATISLVHTGGAGPPLRPADGQHPAPPPHHTIVFLPVQCPLPRLLTVCARLSSRASAKPALVFVCVYERSLGVCTPGADAPRPPPTPVATLAAGAICGELSCLAERVVSFLFFLKSRWAVLA